MSKKREHLRNFSDTCLTKLQNYSEQLLLPNLINLPLFTQFSATKLTLTFFVYLTQLL